MIIHPDVRLAAIPTPDGALLPVSRLGPEAGSGTLVYLHSPFTSPGYWGPLAGYLRAQFEGRISQLAYHQRTAHRHPDRHARTASLSAIGADDLDAVLAEATGAIVLVAHSAASRLVLSWVEKYPRRARSVAGIVLFNPVLEIPDIPVVPAPRVQGALLDHFYRAPGDCGRAWRGVNATFGDRLHIGIGVSVAATYGSPALTDTTLAVWRCVPTWVLTGALDPLIPPGRCQALAERVWADFDCVPDVGHSLPFVDPRRASQPILAALEVAYRAHLQDGSEPW